MNWEEEFDKKFGVSHDKQEIPEKTWELYAELKYFIKKTREEAVREALEKVESDVVKMKKTEKTLIGIDGVTDETHDAGINYAVYTVLSIINKHKYL